MMTTKDIGSRMKTEDERPTPPGFRSLTSFTLKKTKPNNESSNLAGIQSDVDVEKLQKSVKRRPWILNDQPIDLEEPNNKHLKTVNISIENNLPKGVIRGGSACSNSPKVMPGWLPEESCRQVIDYSPFFYPTEEEFKDIYQYIAKIRPKAEEHGICRIKPPESWKPPPLIIQGNKFESCRFGTRVQQIDELKDLHSKRKLNAIIQRENLMDSDHGFEFECGPEFTLRSFKTHAEQFKRSYFKKQDIFTQPVKQWEKVEGEYWRIVQNPTHQIQVLSGHNLEAKVLGSGFPLPSLDDNQTEYMKSQWNLNNTPNLPGSLLAFDRDNSALLTPRLDVGMCFSSICWNVEEHHLYSLSYLHSGASRIMYGVPAKYRQKCEALLKKNFPELSGHRELFHKLVTQLSPSTLKSEGIPVYRCVQHAKQFVLIFPGAYYSGFDTDFSISEKVNLATLDWLPHGQLTVEKYSELHRKTSLSYDRMLIEAVRQAAKSPWDFRMRGWNNACGKDGWLTRALKSRVRQESIKREFLCDASQSRKMEEGFGCSVKRECGVCFYDLYLSAAGCACSPDKYSCLEHSKQICTCPWSSRFFLFRYEISELNLLIDTLEGKVNPKLV
ncbi:putative transcription factor & chromatin remodeling JUMONJI family [Helianthus annuus]|uniref:Transcription factor & chromatin remodeling JUMONJI family n=2 Tax=Helianthus annuus TaxID=4232 RepID=A0A9K3J7Y4_HELAN|nr:putative lysine-specific demethylase JMJ16 [Helianthus annuus]KAF5810523.1 putative transcription factor & chromatin remodeling JUMONJI family [Helianthus annuus]KAJ0581324.1 putative transcription factor & chromatin remodeling JUMONJI family [Helianthus annuus]KAJ0589261.1 putative transcription factor & chromatin remodeling JUMONJI family [Helianthus annuus]KAJ0597271.1 putative transcription factor & chromatin remodeling JUMONJI family [Helianthus annuus]KAJ0757951.1 putative transcripti